MKPIRVFYSPLSRRFYASRAYREVKPGVIEVTGEKFDVTDDIGELIERYQINFEKKNDSESITCPQCGMTSYHPEDVRQRYCGNCHQFHADMNQVSKHGASTGTTNQ